MVGLPWQYSNAVPGTQHVLHMVLSDLVFQVACLADMHIETELAIFNILIMKQNYNKKNKQTCLCCAFPFPEKSLILLIYIFMVHAMKNTDFLFHGVTCLTLDPVARSDGHGPYGKDFQFTKSHSHRAHATISPD